MASSMPAAMPACSASSLHEERQRRCQPCAPPPHPWTLLLRRPCPARRAGAQPAPTPRHLTPLANVHGAARRSAAGSHTRAPLTCGDRARLGAQGRSQLPTLTLTLNLHPAPHACGERARPGAQGRSRPLQPPQKPEAAPFFLPTVAGLGGAPAFDPPAAPEPAAAAGRKRRARDAGAAAAAQLTAAQGWGAGGEAGGGGEEDAGRGGEAGAGARDRGAAASTSGAALPARGAASIDCT